MNLDFPSVRVMTETGFEISSDHIFPTRQMLPYFRYLEARLRSI